VWAVESYKSVRIRLEAALFPPIVVFLVTRTGLTPSLANTCTYYTPACQGLERSLGFFVQPQRRV